MVPRPVIISIPAEIVRITAEISLSKPGINKCAERKSFIPHRVSDAAKPFGPRRTTNYIIFRTNFIIAVLIYNSYSAGSEIEAADRFEFRHFIQVCLTIAPDAIALQLIKHLPRLANEKP